MSTPLITWFADAACTELERVGGKGANLGRLTAAGFRVPPGFVVTTTAYDAHVAPLREALLAAIAALPDDDPSARDSAVSAMRELIEAAEVPSPVADAIRAAYAELGGGYVAVRSSGTAEDQEGAAFAGLHDTFLDVRGVDELLDAVRRDWASAWTARAVAYRAARRFDAFPSIAVVVQTMVESDVAGVLFTANPLTRDPSQALINAGWGLGESVVQGICTPDHYVVETAGGSVLKTVVGDKDLEIVRNPETGRGVLQRPVEAARRTRASLEPAQVVELARIGAAVQEHYDGAPQDIEWALSGDELWLLQARPITGVTFTTAPDLAASPVHVPGHTARWTTANVDEGLPGTITPLTWSLYFPPTESTMRDCWVDLGVLREEDRPVPDDVDGRFISVAYGHAIANVDLMGQLAARVPGGSAAQMEEQLFGSVQGGGPPPPTGLDKVGRWPLVAIKLPRTLRRAARALDPLAAQTTAWWARHAFSLADASYPAAMTALVDARKQYERVVTVHMVLSIASQAVLGQVESLAARAGQPGLERELIRSVNGTAEFDLVRDLWGLARDELTIEQFVAAHGYHGPREGLVES
ncbi:MAG: PEP-utilizing protein, partial [Solirubrobacterales bacterium]|nr:PEP-utilizing protein [Solirubrobacterales bacterium]